MSDKKISDYFLLLRHILNESLLRDLILFLFIFLLTISQEWDSILLLLFPLITFAFALFFKIINVNKWRTEFDKSSIVYNPLGSEKRNANRFNFTSLLQLILLFWIGAESLYHPQLIDNYFLYFITILVFVYTFGFYWIFVDLWKFSRIEIMINKEDRQNIPQEDSAYLNNLHNVVSFLKLDFYKKIFIATLLSFIILNVLNLTFHILIFFNFFPGIPFNLPGTGIEGSKPIVISNIIYGIIIASPTITIVILILNYRNIVNSFSRDQLKEILNPLPKNIQIKIIANLKAIAEEKMTEELKLE